jgi:two-component system, response regulator RegA
MSQETQLSPKPASALGPILIAEDNKDLLGAYEKFFDSENVEVHLASNPADALIAYSKATNRGHKPEIAIVDFVFEGSDQSGLKLIADLRSVDKDIGIIVITGYSGLTKESIALKQGADLFLTKPIEPFDKILFHCFAVIQKKKEEINRKIEDQKKPLVTANGKDIIVLIAMILIGAFLIFHATWEWSSITALRDLNKSSQDDIKVLRIDLTKQSRDQSKTDAGFDSRLNQLERKADK